MTEPASAFARLGRREPIVEKTIVQRAGRARTALKAARGVLLRLTPSQWEAVHAFALRENVTVQGLLIAALDTVFASRGMPFSELDKTP